MIGNRRPVLRLLLVIGAVALVAIPATLAGRWWATVREPAALVHITFPAGYSFSRKAGWARLDESVNAGNATVYLKPGVQVLQFEKKGRPYGAIVNVRGGGEIYTGFAETDLHPIQSLQEAQ